MAEPPFKFDLKFAVSRYRSAINANHKSLISIRGPQVFPGITATILQYTGNHVLNLLLYPLPARETNVIYLELKSPTGLREAKANAYWLKLWSQVLPPCSCDVLPERSIDHNQIPYYRKLTIH